MVLNSLLHVALQIGKMQQLTAFKKHADSDCHGKVITLYTCISMLSQLYGQGISEVMHENIKEEKKVD